jgi:hypothetical protein
MNENTGTNRISDYPTLREFLIGSELRVPKDRVFILWDNYDRDGVCVSLGEEKDSSIRWVALPGFGRITSHNLGQNIPLTCLDLPFIHDMENKLNRILK